MAKTAFKLKILYGEGEEEVLASQAALIQQAGHQVQTDKPDEATAIIREFFGL